MNAADVATLSAQVTAAASVPAPRPAAAAPGCALSPAQQAAREKLEEALSVSAVVGLVGAPGCGRTTIARALSAAHGGRYLDMGDVFDVSRDVAGAKWEEAVERLVIGAFDDA